MEEAEHDVFERHEDDVIMQMSIDVPTAALGGTVNVPTLAGTAELDIEPGTQPGATLRLKGKGIPHLNSRGRGDQLVEITVFIPKKLSSDERKVLESLKGSKNFTTRDNSSVSSFFNKFKEALS